MTFNTNGSSKGNLGNFGAGDRVRSYYGDWLWGFSLNLRNINNTEAGLWANREGLIQAWNRGYR